MPIPFSCPQCGHQTMVADEFAGQSGPCVQCGASITVPALDASNRLTGARPAKSGGLGVVAGIFMLVGVVVLLFCGVGLLVTFRARSSYSNAVSTAATASTRAVVGLAACNQNLKRIGLAMAAYHDVHGSFPPAYVADENGRPKHSWRVLLLPYLDQKDLYDKYDMNEPWDGPNNSVLALSMPDVYACPDDITKVGTYVTSYLAITGEGTVFDGANCVKLADITDGPDTTLLVVEVDGAQVKWTEPRDVDLGTLDPTNNASSNSLSIRHTVGSQALFADGSVHLLTNPISPTDVQRMSKIKDGEPVVVPP